MSDLDALWLVEFDKALQENLAITRHDAGLTDDVVRRYADLPPVEAALLYGEDYDLQRVNWGWLG
jgi:hypothetical protein